MARLDDVFYLWLLIKKSRKALERLFNSLQENGYPDIAYEYLSWIDGATQAPLSIDQFISEKVFSLFIDHRSVLFQSNSWKSYSWNHADILAAEKNHIIFDVVHKKIYIDGERLGHKDVRSQLWTVEIMEVLFDNMWKPVHNKSFPVSSYSKNKNEMLGKIITPLQEIIKERTWEDLHIKCGGNIYDFYTTLEYTSIPIAIIRSVY